MSSVRLVCCQPGRFLLRRTNSKSSLDIGVRPVDGSVVKMELHHYTNRIHQGIGKRNSNINPPGLILGTQILWYTTREPG